MKQYEARAEAEEVIDQLGWSDVAVSIGGPDDAILSLIDNSGKQRLSVFRHKSYDEMGIYRDKNGDFTGISVPLPDVTLIYETLHPHRGEIIRFQSTGADMKREQSAESFVSICGANQIAPQQAVIIPETNAGKVVPLPNDDATEAFLRRLSEGELMPSHSSESAWKVESVSTPSHPLVTKIQNRM